MVGLQGISTKTPGFPSKRRGFLRFPAADPGSHPFGESGNPCSRTPPNRPTHTRDRHLGGQVFPPQKKNCVSRRVVSNPFHSPLQCVAPGSHMGASENAGCNPLTNQCFQLFKSSDTPTYNPENSLETIGNQHVALVWPALSHNFLASTLIDPPVAHPLALSPPQVKRQQDSPGASGYNNPGLGGPNFPPSPPPHHHHHHHHQQQQQQQQQARDCSSSPSPAITKWIERKFYRKS